MIENSIYMQYILTWNLIIGVVKFFAEWFFAKNSREEKNNSQRIWRTNFPREDVAAAPRAPSNYPTMQTRKWGRRAGGPPFGPTRQPLQLAPLTVSTSEVGPEGGGLTYGAHPSASPASPVSGIPIRAQRHARPTRPPTWTGPTCRTSSRAVGSHPPRPIGRPGWSATSGPPPPHHRLRLRLFFFFSLSLSLDLFFYFFFLAMAEGGGGNEEAKRTRHCWGFETSSLIELSCSALSLSLYPSSWSTQQRKRKKKIGRVFFSQIISPISALSPCLNESLSAVLMVLVVSWWVWLIDFDLVLLLAVTAFPNQLIPVRVCFDTEVIDQADIDR